MANKPNFSSVPSKSSDGTSPNIVNATIYPRSANMFARMFPIPVINGYDQHVNVINAASVDRDFVPEPYYSIAITVFEVWGNFEFGPGYVDQHYLAQWYLENLAQPVMYSLDSGILPPGLTLTNVSSGDIIPVYTAQGQIEGIPTHVGSYDFELRAVGPGTNSVKLFTINIGEGGDQTSYLYGN